MSVALGTQDLLIRTLPTPNPFALKFVLNASLKDEGKATFSNAMECADLPLVRDLFLLEGVKQAHLFQNTLTVTHSGQFAPEAVTSMDDLGEKVTAIVRSRFAIHDPSFGAPKPLASAVHERQVSDDPKIQAIEEILDRTIRPGLQADGGDIEIMGLENSELRILYQGACGGCPSAMMGTLDAIQGILRNELNDENLMVVPV